MGGLALAINTASLLQYLEDGGHVGWPFYSLSLIGIACLAVLLSAKRAATQRREEETT